MISFFYGADYKKRGESFAKAFEQFVSEHPDYLLTRIDADRWSQSLFENAVGGNSFFHTGASIVAKDLFSHKEAPVFLSEFLEQPMSDVVEIFFVDEELPKEIVKKVGKRKDVSLFEYPIEKKPAERSSLAFDLARAIEKGDKKTAWLILERSRLDGVAAEELLWGVVWKIKDTLAKSRTGDMAHTKASEVSRELIRIYHESKNGGIEFELAFERLLLAL